MGTKMQMRWGWPEADGGFAKASHAYLMHQKVLLHALLGQVAQLLHGFIHALAGAQLLH